MFQSLIHKTLDGFKKRLVNNKLTIQGENGLVEEVSFSFNEPATDQEIQDFIKQTGLHLPDDYQAFLRLHNGVTLFQPWFGGQMDLCSLSEVENKMGIVGFFPEHWYPIGCQDGHFLMIDANKVNQGEMDYLMWWDSSLVEDAKHLGLNFALWLDRFIVSQGARFWEWPRIDVHRCYRWYQL